MKNLSEYVNEASKTELNLNIDVNVLLEKLQVALAEEFNAWYQYFIVCPYAFGNERSEIVETFKEQAKDELEDHACWLMERINQLGAEPINVISPDMWNKTAEHKYLAPTNFDIITLLEQNIEAEIGAIETYTELEKFTRDKDVVTNTKIKEILADEQEHLQNLQDLLKDIK